MRHEEAEIAFRMDGVLVPITKIPDPLATRLCGRIKFLARLKTYQESLPQDGRIDKAAVSSSADIRVATYPTVTGEKVVLRLFRSEEVKTFAGLELPEDVSEVLLQWLKRPSGLALFTGPAGSGKTSTIYACLAVLAGEGGRHVITVEDPVEQVIPGIMQTETNEARGLDFAMAARHLLRQDPQVLVIGEIRDEQTAQIALRAALTGHMVISTLHAGSCHGVLERMAAFCADASSLAAAVDLIFNQRLARKVCPECHGAGCEKCLQTGFRGRLPLVEFFAIDDAARGLIRAGQFQKIAATIPLADRGKSLVNAGLTTPGEIARVL
jgi:type II secretory ATPase GspE/PulE/Tfp pilus assembly ATPase PilB-like protein